MGHVFAEFMLSNPRDSNLKPVTVKALVDTGAQMVCIPETIAIQLNLQETEKRTVTVADGRSVVVPYVGPLQVNFENRTSFTGALVLGDMVLMGAIPLEDMDLVISPSRRSVTVNPLSPNIPHSLVV